MKEELKSNHLSFFILSDGFFTKKAIRSALEGTIRIEQHSFSFNGEASTTEDFLLRLPQLTVDILFLDTRLLAHEQQQVISFVKNELPQTFIVLLNDSLTNPIQENDLDNHVIVLEKPLHYGYLVRTIRSMIEENKKNNQKQENDVLPLLFKETTSSIEKTETKTSEPLTTELFEKNTVAFAEKTEKNLQEEQIISNKTEILPKITDTFSEMDESFSKTEDISHKVEDFSLKIEEKNPPITENISNFDDLFELNLQEVEEIKVNSDSSIPISLSRMEETSELMIDDFYLESTSNSENENNNKSLITFELEPSSSIVLNEQKSVSLANNSIDKDALKNTFNEEKAIDLSVATTEGQEERDNDGFITFELTADSVSNEYQKNNEDISFSLEEETMFIFSNDEQNQMSDHTIDLSHDISPIASENNVLAKEENPIELNISFDLNSTTNQKLNPLDNELTFDLVDNVTLDFDHSELVAKELNSSLPTQNDDSTEIKLNFKSKKERSFKLDESNSFDLNPYSEPTKETVEKLTERTVVEELSTSNESPNSKNEYKNGATIYNETTPSFSTKTDLNFNLNFEAMDSDDKDDEVVITPPKAFYPSGVDRQTQRLNKVRNQHQNQWGPKNNN